MSGTATLIVLVMVILGAGTAWLASMLGVPGSVKEPPKPKQAPEPVPVLAGEGRLGQISQEAFAREAQHAIAARSILPGVEPDDSPGMQMKVLAGVAVSALVILVMGAYVIYEPAREAEAAQAQLTANQERGGKLFTTYCATCHGPTGTGLIGPNLHLQELVANPITKGLSGTTYSPTDPSDLSKLHDFLVKTISTGVPGTPMPTWGDQYGGALNETQIDDLATLIVNNGWATYVHPTAAQLAVASPTPAAGGAAPSGQDLMVKYGCGGCHTIQGVTGFTGTVGPELTHVGSVTSIPKSKAILTNTPDNVAKWVYNAPSVEPGVIMPNFSAQGMTQDQAKAIAQYLETLK